MRRGDELIGWYYKRGGQHLGPLSTEQVGRLLASGALRPTEMLVEIAEAGGGVRYSYLDATSVAERAMAGRPSG